MKETLFSLLLCSRCSRPAWIDPVTNVSKMSGQCTFCSNIASSLFSDQTSCGNGSLHTVKALCHEKPICPNGIDNVLCSPTLPEDPLIALCPECSNSRWLKLTLQTLQNETLSRSYFEINPKEVHKYMDGGKTLCPKCFDGKWVHIKMDMDGVFNLSLTIYTESITKFRDEGGKVCDLLDEILIFENNDEAYFGFPELHLIQIVLRSEFATFKSRMYELFKFQKYGLQMACGK